MIISDTLASTSMEVEGRQDHDIIYKQGVAGRVEHCFDLGKSSVVADSKQRAPQGRSG